MGKQSGNDAQAVGDVTRIAAALQVEVEVHEGIEAVDGRFFGILALQRFDTVPDLAQFEAVPPRYQCVLSDKLMMSGSLAAEPFLFSCHFRSFPPILPLPMAVRRLRVADGVVMNRLVAEELSVFPPFCLTLPKPQSTGRVEQVSVLKGQEGAPLNLG